MAACIIDSGGTGIATDMAEVNLARRGGRIRRSKCNMFHTLHKQLNRRRARSWITRTLRVEPLDDRTLPSVGLAYVDDTWRNTNLGAQPTPDPVGGLVFGTDAFADIQSGINALTDGGTLVIYGGTYPGAVNVNKALAAIQVTTNAGTPAEALVAINGVVTLTNSAT